MSQTQTHQTQDQIAIAARCRDAIARMELVERALGFAVLAAAIGVALIAAAAVFGR